jgi:hypothetical protein
MSGGKGEKMKILLDEMKKRLKQHRDNLTLWLNGSLNQTEPDETERQAIIRGLQGAINELEYLNEFYINN